MKLISMIGMRKGVETGISVMGGKKINNIIRVFFIVIPCVLIMSKSLFTN